MAGDKKSIVIAKDYTILREGCLCTLGWTRARIYQEEK